MSLRWLALASALILATGCGGKKRKDPAAAASRDAGATVPAAPDAAALVRCVHTFERARSMPATERAGTLVRGCGLCAGNWDPLIGADRADTGAPVDIAAVGAIVKGCDGFCTKQAATTFKEALGELMPGKASSRPWKLLGEACKAQLSLDEHAQRFASGAWFALASINRALIHGRDRLDPAAQATLDAALPQMYVALPPVSAAGTGYVVPNGSRRTGTPWRHITVTAEAIFVGKLPFAWLSPHGLGIIAGDDYPGKQLAGAAELAATLDATTDTTPRSQDPIDAPVIIAPRAAAATIVTAAMAALGTHRAHLAVAAPAPAALWRGLVAAQPMPLAAAAAATGTRLRFTLGVPRIAVVDAKGAVLVSAPLPADGKLLVERWTAAAVAVARGHTIEIVAGDGKVDDLAALLDATATGGAVLAVPAPAHAPMTGHDQPQFDPAALAAALGPPPLSSEPSPTRPPP